MKFSVGISHLLIIFLTCNMIACKNTQKEISKSNNPVSDSTLICGNGVYYWKTVFQWKEYDQDFTNKHGIKRLYLRLFDVDLDKESNMAVPIATIRFIDHVPEDLEIVPVVYITTASLKDIEYHANDMFNRIRAIGKRNGFPAIREIQLDCDWSESNKEQFFSLCKKIKTIASKDNINISATIRLHQLKQDPPPVDRGMLMLYNTGSIYNPSTDNSILTYNDVKPYLREEINYPLPLSAAYPTYAWSILLRNNEFMAILHKTDFRDESLYKETGNNIYKVVKEHYLENKLLRVGDKIRMENSDIEEISAVQSFVKKKIPRIESVSLYHLDSLNMSKYSKEEIENILK